MAELISGILTIGVCYLLSHWDEINWKLTDIPDDCDLDFDEMTRDEIKGISPRKNKNQYYKNYCNGKYFKKKDE